MSALGENIFALVKHFQNRQAKSLSSRIVRQIVSLRDQNNSTLLHISANNNNYQMAQYFINQFKKMMEKQSSLYNIESKIGWLCAKDNQGFSCLHYAVFRDNFKMVKLFQQNGSDIYQINTQGLTVLHIAAQGNSPLLIYYFLMKGLNISVTDQKGNTPLHWACYSGMEDSAFALISWGAQLDRKQQTLGMTPLHLAVMSGNGRIVRKLLIKGCDRNVQNYQKIQPLKIAKQYKFQNIEQMIKDQRGLGELCNLKPSYRKVSKVNISFIIFVSLFLSCYILNIVSFSITKHEIFQKGLYITFAIVGFVYAILFICLFFSNPGYLAKSEEIHRNMFQILGKYKAKKICFDCGIVKPDRSKHCEICYSCISVYDHHCPWVGNCVGSNNYCLFYIFIVLTLVIILHTIGLEISILVYQNWNKIDKWDWVKIVSSVYSLLVAFIFLVPILILIFIQTKNACQNMTTLQRYSKNQQNKLRQQSSRFRQSLKQQLVENSARNKQSKIQLTEFSVAHSSSMSVQRNTGAVEVKTLSSNQLHAASLNNCYKMCWQNKSESIYYIGQ